MPCTELYVRLGDEEVLVLDCRDPKDWECYGLHIPGALWMCYEELIQDARVLPDDELIVVYGLAPDDADAHRACRLLQQRGRSAVCLEGGLRTWISLGLPTEHHAAEASVEGMC